MIKAIYFPYKLNFIIPGGTSRGVLKTKDTYFIKLWNDKTPEIFGIGEAALFRGLSSDDVPDYEHILEQICQNPEKWIENKELKLNHYPSILFGLETALLDLQNGGKRIIFPSDFTLGKKGIRINGLIWMGEPDFMLKQIDSKLKEGFTCLKIKIGAINFEQEYKILQEIRQSFSANQLELRVDANGAFSANEALQKLQKLAKLDIHSIEQPIKASNFDKMADLCANTPLAIALDEELIGVFESAKKQELLEKIKPQYIILKPAIIGGFCGTNEWIKIAKKQNIKWWITSALESNIGLNAIAQFTNTLNNSMPQGLGTGKVFSNNIESPLLLKGDNLFYSSKSWNLSNINVNFS